MVLGRKKDSKPNTPWDSPSVDAESASESSKSVTRTSAEPEDSAEAVGEQHVENVVVDKEVTEATNAFRGKLKFFPMKFNNKKRQDVAETAPEEEPQAEVTEEPREMSYLEHVYGEKEDEMGQEAQLDEQAEPEEQREAIDGEMAIGAHSSADLQSHSTSSKSLPTQTVAKIAPGMTAEGLPNIAGPVYANASRTNVNVGIGAEEIALAAYGDQGRSSSKAALNPYGPTGNLGVPGYAPEMNQHVYTGTPFGGAAEQRPAVPAYGVGNDPYVYPQVQNPYKAANPDGMRPVSAPISPNTTSSRQLDRGMQLVKNGVALEEAMEYQTAYNTHVEAIETLLTAVKAIKSDYEPGTMKDAVQTAEKYVTLLFERCEYLLKSGKARKRSQQKPKSPQVDRETINTPPPQRGVSAKSDQLLVDSDLNSYFPEVPTTGGANLRPPEVSDENSYLGSVGSFVPLEPGKPGGQMGNAGAVNGEHQLRGPPVSRFSDSLVDNDVDGSGSVSRKPGMKCSICLTNAVTTILPCGHTYCEKCVDAVFNTFEQCAACDRPVERPEAKKLAL
ncbi:hypothetical protein NDN08_008343 [Rhodosorus marinus]|uniref:RING-type domain-containing protein n=1 Tax=Rhodosorus marinus TaxID=101924 RepID=A0AAV8V3H6_9RHOD|nr:hypothetical protein NDN08_008343 [Rhodosorus marinus]